jgi:CRISPR-associated endonuclease/helicase Cas3
MSENIYPVAHIAEDGREQLLEEHLNATAELAADFAKEFGSDEWAYLAGLWHDLGKFSEVFQKHIRFQDKKGVDHSTYGAKKAVEDFKEPGRLLSYIIAGHHAGLPDWQSETSGKSGLFQRLNNANIQPIVAPPEYILAAERPVQKPKPGIDPSMWIRMLFSCLVDADFLDTEAFMEPKKAKGRSIYPSLKELLPSFNSYMAEKKVKSDPTEVNKIRSLVLRECVSKAMSPSGIFSLSVPTGGGKTLSSMAFALNHAVKYGKKRIIYAIPYTSIIEQTADQFREIFGDSVIEHHSNVEISEPDENSRARLAAENWDAPIIITTNVQFFESLFASRSSKCRKLHNIINSVVILDEAQLLPPDYLKPICYVLMELQKKYNVTIVLSTATLPALKSCTSFDFTFQGLDDITEIIDDPNSLHSSLNRVNYKIPDDLYKEMSWEELAQKLSLYDNVLCIVNRRDDAQRLFRLMPEETIHLSALMCGAHRSEVITKIKQRLRNGEPTRVVSTQLVEAGVDIDFPVVYRALSGLDSIAQAAGRCNREGLLETGEVFVFIPQSQSPPGLLKQAADIGRCLLGELNSESLPMEFFNKYFKELYWLRGDKLDAKGVLMDLAPDGELRFSFRTASEKFHIIDDSLYKPVLVRYGNGADLINLLEKEGPQRWLMRKLQRFTVNVPKYHFNALYKNGDIEELCPGIYTQSSMGQYHPNLGLSYKAGMIEPDDLII